MTVTRNPPSPIQADASKAPSAIVAFKLALWKTLAYARVKRRAAGTAILVLLIRLKPFVVVGVVYNVDHPLCQETRPHTQKPCGSTLKPRVPVLAHSEFRCPLAERVPGQACVLQVPFFFRGPPTRPLAPSLPFAQLGSSSRPPGHQRGSPGATVGGESQSKGALRITRPEG